MSDISKLQMQAFLDATEGEFSLTYISVRETLTGMLAGAVLGDRFASFMCDACDEWTGQVIKRAGGGENAARCAGCEAKFMERDDIAGFAVGYNLRTEHGAVALVAGVCDECAKLTSDDILKKVMMRMQEDAPGAVLHSMEDGPPPSGDKLH